MTTRGKRRLAVLLGAVVLLVGAGALMLQLREVRRDRLARMSRVEGLAAHAAGDHETVLVRLGYTLSRHRDDPEALIAWADSRAHVPQVNDRHLTTAVNCYREVLDREPRRLDALEPLLDLYQRLGFDVETIAIADRLLAIDADHRDALAARAGAAFRRGNMDDAAALAGRLAALEPDRLRWRALQIEAARRQGHTESDLLAQCEQWAAESDGDGRFHLLEGQLLQEMGRLEDARAAVVAATERGADDVEVLDGMLDACDELDMAPTGDALLETMRTRRPEARWVQVASVRRHFRALRIEEGLREIDAMQRPHAPEVLRWQAMLQLVDGDHDAAARTAHLLREQADAPGAARADRAWADALLLRVRPDDWTTVLPGLREAVIAAPQDPSLHYLLADACVAIGEHELALAALEKAAPHAPGWSAIRVLRLRALLAQGRGREAFEVAANALRQGAHDDRTARLLVSAWYAMGEEGRHRRLNDPATGRSIDLPELAHHLYTGRPTPGFAVLAADSAWRRGQVREATAFVDERLADLETDPETLLALARWSAGEGLGMEHRLIDRAAAAGAAPGALASTEAVVLGLAGKPEEALARLDRAVARGNGDAWALRAMRCRFAVEAGRTVSPESVASLLRDAPGTPPGVAGADELLGMDATWRDRALVETVLDHLAEVVGPRTPRVLVGRAIVLATFARDDDAALAQATSLAREALELVPRSRAALSLLANLALTRPGGTDEAIGLLRTAVEQHPDALELHAQLIALLQQRGDFDAARSLLEDLARRPESREGHGRLTADLLDAQGDFDRAAVRLAALVGTEGDAEQRRRLARLYWRAGRYEQAEPIFERLLAAHGDDPAIVADAADFLAATDRFDEGLALLEALEPPGGEAERALLMGRFLSRFEGDEEAGAQLRRAASLAPDRADAWYELMNYHLERDECERAYDAAMRGLRVDPKNRPLRMGLAALQWCLQDARQENVREVLSGMTDDNPAALQAIVLLDRLMAPDAPSRPDEATLAEARRLVDTAPEFMAAWHIAVLAHLMADLHTEAVELSRRAVARFPREAAPAELATHALLQAQRDEEALETARLWRRRSMDDPLAASVAIASLLLRRDRAEEALAELEPYSERIVRERAAAPDALGVWLGVLAKNGRYEQAAAAIAPLLAEGEPWTGLWLRIADSMPADAAAAALRLAAPHLDRDVRDRLRLAGGWVALARRADDSAAADRALMLLDPLLETAPVPVLLMQGSLDSARGDHGAAMEKYERALVLDADNLVAMNNGAVAAVALGDCERGLELARGAARLAPDDPPVLDSLAQAQLCAGAPEEAERLARAAVEARQSDPASRLTLARALYEQRRFAEAWTVLETASTERPPLRGAITELRGRLETALRGAGG